MVETTTEKKFETKGLKLEKSSSVEALGTKETTIQSISNTVSGAITKFKHRSKLIILMGHGAINIVNCYATINHLVTSEMKIPKINSEHKTVFPRLDDSGNHYYFWFYGHNQLLDFEKEYTALHKKDQILLDMIKTSHDYAMIGEINKGKKMDKNAVLLIVFVAIAGMFGGSMIQQLIDGDESPTYEIKGDYVDNSQDSNVLPPGTNNNQNNTVVIP